MFVIVIVFRIQPSQDMFLAMVGLTFTVGEPYPGKSRIANMITPCAFTMGEGIGVTFLDVWWAEFHAGKELRSNLVGLPGSAVAEWLVNGLIYC